jgi:hypothetical protein
MEREINSAWRGIESEQIHTEDDDTRCSISAFFVLSSTELNHIFRSGMRHIDFTKDCVSVISKAEERFVILREKVAVTTHRMPPIGSKIIFNMAFGPKHVRMTSATVFFWFKPHTYFDDDSQSRLPLQL